MGPTCVPGIRSPEEGVEFPGAGVTSDYRRLDMGSGNGT